MKINKTEWTIRKVTEGYNDLKQKGCFSMKNMMHSLKK